MKKFLALALSVMITTAGVPAYADATPDKSEYEVVKERIQSLKTEFLNSENEEKLLEQIEELEEKLENEELSEEEAKRIEEELEGDWDEEDEEDDMEEE